MGKPTITSRCTTSGSPATRTDSSPKHVATEEGRVTTPSADALRTIDLGLSPEGLALYEELYRDPDSQYPPFCDGCGHSAHDGDEDGRCPQWIFTASNGTETCACSDVRAP